MDKTIARNVHDLARAVWTSLGSPVALQCLEKGNAGDWSGLARLSVDPRMYQDPSLYVRDNAAVCLLKKFKGLPTGINRSQAAFDKWLEGERDCYKTNERLTRFLPEFVEPQARLDSDSDARILGVIAELRKIVRALIGDSPPDLLSGRFGPGATYADRGGKSTILHKLSSKPTLTHDAMWYLPQWGSTMWAANAARRHGDVSFVRGNRYSTAPKTSLTDRSIAVEPSINVYYQLALGAVLKRRLARAGWSLDRAQDVHRQVARESSVSLEFATLDLSNASDTVATTLVRLLLPSRWFHAMDDLRSKFTRVGTSWRRLEKFSSMGNGFTFELETVIFAALAIFCSRLRGHEGRLGKDVFVFGDDIIVKDDVVSELIPCLKFFGFTPNSEKSFWGPTPFRESCGGDYFAGRPVRGFYLKDELEEPQTIIAAANGIRALYSRVEPSGFARDLRPWFTLLDQLPLKIRACRGPQDLGDIVIHDEPSKWTCRVRDSIRYLQVYKPVRSRITRFTDFDPEVALATRLYAPRSDDRRLTRPNQADTELLGVIPRDSVTGYAVRWVPFS